MRLKDQRVGCCTICYNTCIPKLGPYVTDSLLSRLDVRISALILLISLALLSNFHCVKIVRIRSYSGPHFLTFGLNTERYGVSRRMQFKCGKMRTRITPNTYTFHAVFCIAGNLFIT